MACVEQCISPVTWIPVGENGTSRAGQIDVQQVVDAVRDDTLFISVMLANNEIGVIQDIEAIGKITELPRPEADKK